MNAALTIECNLHVGRKSRGARKVIERGSVPAAPMPGRVPRVARLMALAIRLASLHAEGEVSSYAELARLGRVTRARMTQIMNLVNLAPDIQEAILFLPRVARGRDPIHLRMLQPIARTADWREQRALWRQLHRGMSAAEGDGT